jgi:hypothetical protein
MTRPAGTRRPLNVATIGLIGVVIGGLFGAVPAFVSIFAEDVRSSNEFLRGQRQAAYAQFIVAEQSLRQSETDWYRLKNNDPDRDGVPPPPTLEQLAKVAEQTKDGYQKVAEGAAAVELVGSSDAKEASESIRSSHQLIQGCINPVGIETDTDGAVSYIKTQCRDAPG